MQPDPGIPSGAQQLQSASLPPLPPAAAPPVIPVEPSAFRHFIAALLNLCLGLLLADGIISLVDDSLILLFQVHVLGLVRGLSSVVTFLVAAVVYPLMGITLLIPKRWFLPVTLFAPVAMLAAVPLWIFNHARMPEMSWALSLGQVLLGLGILYGVQGGFRFRWPLLAVNQLGARVFGWRNFWVFLLVNIFVVPPVVVIYLFTCSALAVGHFSDGFVALRSGGLSVQVRKYVRDDGKTILLVPMAHVGEADFYRTLSQSFPTNAIILMEGVTDESQLLTNKITYERMAATLGLAEQQEEFQPRGSEIVPADVDIAAFAPSTIGLLNQLMRIHSQGLTAQNLKMLLQFSPPPAVQTQLLEDLLRLRNRHLLNELQARLPESDFLIVPWGAAHIPEIAAEIQKTGFRVVETQDHVAIRFY